MFEQAEPTGEEDLVDPTEDFEDFDGVDESYAEDEDTDDGD